MCFSIATSLSTMGTPSAETCPFFFFFEVSASPARDVVCGTQCVAAGTPRRAKTPFFLPVLVLAPSVLQPIITPNIEGDDTGINTKSNTILYRRKSRADKARELERWGERRNFTTTVTHKNRAGITTSRTCQRLALQSFQNYLRFGLCVCTRGVL